MKRVAAMNQARRLTSPAESGAPGARAFGAMGWQPVEAG